MLCIKERTESHSKHEWLLPIHCGPSTHCLKIPAGAQHGNLVKIKGAGIPIISKPSQRGDHIVILKIKIPTKLNKKQEALYKELYEFETGKVPPKSIMSKVKGVFK